MSKRQNLRRVSEKNQDRRKPPRLLEWATFLTALLGLAVAASQAVTLIRQVKLEKSAALPIIRSQNVYGPIPDDPAASIDARNHSLRFIGNTELISAAALGNITVAGFSISDSGPEGPATGILEVPLLAYFEFCDVELDFSSREIGMCFGQNNFLIHEEIQRKVSSVDPEGASFRLAGIRNYSKIDYVDIEGKSQVSYLVTSEIGMLEVGENPRKFDHFSELIDLGFFIDRDFSVSEILYAIRRYYGSESITLPNPETPEESTR